MPVRLGVPQEFKGLADVIRNPIYSTGVGLLHYGMKQHGTGGSSHSEQSRESPLIKVKRWFKGNF